MIRSLDPLESYFATMNRHVPTHFVMAASLTGSVEDQRWAVAFRSLQERNVLLRATIRQGPIGELVFQEDSIKAVPVFFVPRSSADDWKLRYAEEVRQPFAEHDSPLVRVTVLRDSAHTDVVIACHHAISDAMGIVFLLRDLFTLVNGHELPTAFQDVPLSVTELWEDRRPTLLALDVPQPASSAGRQYLQDPGVPEVLTTVLSKDETRALRARATERKVSLHAALCAAAILAGGRMSNTWRAAPVRLATPVDLRTRLQVGETFSLALTAFGHSHKYTEREDLWGLASEIHQVLLASTTDAALLTASKALGALMQAGQGADVLPLLVAFSPAYELMVSNLRVLPLERTAGPLQPEAVLGPTALQQFDGQQSLGVSTYAGRLQLTHASYTIIPGLLKELVNILTLETLPVCH